MKISVKKNDVFIPEYNGNRKLPEGEQIKFHHRFLTTEEREQFFYIKNFTQGQAMAVQVMTKNEKEAERLLTQAYTPEIVRDLKGAAKAITTKIENLELDCDGKVEKIETIEKFYSAPDAYRELKLEYEDYVGRLSARADSKNS